MTSATGATATAGLVPGAPPAAAPARAPNPATLRLLRDPIGRTILRLAAPNAIAMTVQTAVSIADTRFVGQLGTASLAGYAMVFPFIALMQMLSSGSVGGGINSAVARALGAGNRDRADALALHAVVIGIAMGLIIGAIMLLFGRSIYSAMGGTGPALEAALTYSGVAFIGAAIVCLSNSLASVFRGTGNMLVPSLTLVAVTVIQIPLSYAMTLGWGPIPRMGIAGTGLSYVVAFAVGVLIQGALLLRDGRAVRLTLRLGLLRWALFADILKVGALAGISSFQTTATIIVTTGFIGTFGTAAIAGYGIGARLEIMQIPIIFGIGTTLVAIIGANIGAGQVERARRAAWVGALAAATIVGAIGLTVTVAPWLWIGLFTDDPPVIAAATAYLRTVGPCYFFFGLGICLYFASQGAGKVFWPVIAGTVRLGIVVLGGWMLVRMSGTDVEAVFLVLAAAMALFGLMVAAAVHFVPWGKRGA